jgi:BlaI family transcriptional regulator, penicillinase repressor
MGRPTTRELTDRELEVMHAFWRCGEMTATAARDELAAAGHDLAYVTVANLARILLEKGFLEATNDQRPFRYRPVRSFDDVSRGFVGDLLERVFQGSREQLLVNLFGRRKKLTAKERALLEQILKEQTS